MTKEIRRSDHEEAKNFGVGGEGDSSRAHGISDGDWDDQLLGLWTYILIRYRDDQKRVNRKVYSLLSIEYT